ncbi:RHS repeat protein [Pseudomonas monteilii]|uniref:RHS repeat protein n=2 Tax=Pseudomonas TaxID=286 RepID=A0A7X3F0K3_9PSED|nr:RHS repeat protein [Pseudomonas monteilii]MBZ3664303.1 RHS repeat protein [Pseudomonas monteilii]MBZ3669487.1 RHS repeat protein [Pseudomonas monteilii]MVF48932.1 RHS repeat protein [Pseudomonas monteilii]BBV96035.1 sugar-binding protein [Pseudomonas monteilii]
MTTNSLVHSNAFNFMSFVQGGVDPRTGQYNVSLALPELVANRLSGPNLPLHIGFNPMNPEDSGFGAGWRLNLSEYDPQSQMLSLHSGERFKVFDNGPGTQPVIPERKIDSFHFENISAGATTLYRVAHKSLMIEVLGLHDVTEQGQPNSKKVALPVRVLTPTGDGITLTYQQVDVPSPMPGIPAKRVPCLASVEDDSKRKLLEINYANLSRVLITLNPGSAAQVTYTLERENSELVKVVLPTADKGRWAFEYKKIGQVRCIERMRTPVNGIEEIFYKDEGHALPGAGRRTLPHVERHLVSPGANQPQMRTDYVFSSNNFLGNNTGISFDDSGEDNLYKVTGADYFYDSTATHYKGDTPVYTVKTSFNRFHLMVDKVTTQNDCIETLTLQYPATGNRPFKDLDNNFQLAERTTTSWRKGAGGTAREQSEMTRYDHHGNLVEKTEANGKRTLMSYYPAADDPDTFVRLLKTEEVIPGPGEAGAKTLLREYRYQTVASRDDDGYARGASMRSHEQLRVRDGAVLSTLETHYHDKPLNPLEHGRAREQTLTLNGKATLTEYAYSEVSVDGHAAVQTQETVTGFDHGEPLPARELINAKGNAERHAQKVITVQHSILIGEPLLNYDDNQVQIAYAYDELRRVTRETVDPKGKYSASRSYSYYLSSDGQQAWQMQTDVKGVKSWSYVDGLNRAVRVTRQDPDFGRTRQAREEERLSYTARYDELGNLVEETDYDWLELKNLPLRTLYEYDDWRQRRVEIGPDKVRMCTEIDPVGLPDRLGPVHKEWRESIDRRQVTGVTITRLNLFDAPVDVERLDSKGARASLHRYFYDGLGRTVREVDARGFETATTYDEFDRQVDQTLADGSVVHRDYALHSAADLPTLIKVLDSTDGGDYVLGTQTFDGLDRMVESVTGGRKRTMLFGIGQRQPEAVITPSDHRIDYEYLPQLGEEPLSRKTLGKNAAYTYDEHNARLLQCTENEEMLEREYYSTGELKVERRQHNDEAQPHEMFYVHSLKGRLLGYTDVLGKTQSYEYNSLGQLYQTSLENVTSTFRYDELGRTASILTETVDEDGSQRCLETQLFYDDFEREVRRRFDFGDAVQTLAQTYNEVDGIDSKTLTAGEQEGDKLRHETFEYDDRARLSKYTCEGVSEYVPVDPYGNKIDSQLFRFDGRDNITRVRTDFEGGRLNATYQFTNEHDPVQLMGITLQWVAVAEADGEEQEVVLRQEEIELKYDPDGNLILDEQQRELTYDPMGRLQTVHVPSQGITASYGYDPLDRLASQDA